MAGSATAASPAPSGADLRASIIAEMSGPAESPPAQEAAPAEPAAQPAEETAPQDESVEASANEATQDDESEDDEAAPTDPDTAKRLDVVRRAEKRWRAQVEAKEAELSAREQKYAERLARAEEVDRLAARAKYDPGALLRALGVTDDDFEPLAQALYAESKAGQADPKRREIAAKLLREREQADKLSAIEKRAIELEQKLERQQQEARAEAEAARYFEQMNATAAAKHPLVAHLLKADPDDTAQALVASYERLMTKSNGKAPPAAAVVAEFDKTVRAKFKRLGLDPETMIRKPVGTTATAPAKTNGKPAAPQNANATPTKEQILAELASGEFADS